MNEVTKDRVIQQVNDDDIYLTEDRRIQPKEYFKQSLSLINLESWPKDITLLDIGCATGDYIHFLKGQYNQFNYIGLDNSEAMITEAFKRDPSNSYILGDVQDCTVLPNRSVDIITCFGVISCLDDIKLIFKNLMKWIKPGGLIIILDNINMLPIDSITRFRRASKEASLWEAGWNTYSSFSLEREFIEYAQIQSFEFVPFEISINISPRHEDPMRSWTIKTENKPRQLINGAGQMINLSFIPIYIKKDMDNDIN
jgi:ubiquinone/menaquinone biosynthesis C-methylase UbiE